MLPTKRAHSQPVTIHCPLDHLRMRFITALQAYRCNLSGCPVAYAHDKGYYRILEGNDAAARDTFYAQAAICLCENDDLHPLYIEEFVAARNVRFWVCPVPACGYEVSQRLEKTPAGWRTCGSFEHTTPVRIRR